MKCTQPVSGADRRPTRAEAGRLRREIVAISYTVQRAFVGGLAEPLGVLAEPLVALSYP
jgi:hypothetical protein